MTSKLKIQLKEFRSIPTRDTADSTRWILYHDEVGCYLLDAAIRLTTGKRAAGIALPDAAIAWRNFPVDQGVHVVVEGNPCWQIAAPLPANAPNGGPALYEAALAAFEAAYDPTPLRLREGRTRAEPERVLRAAAMLVPDRRDARFTSFACRWNPDLPIEAPKHRFHPNRTTVLDDIGNWFGAWSLQGPSATLNASREYAWLEIPTPLAEPTAHDLLAARAAVIEFYDRAAADLGLTPSDVDARLSALTGRGD